MKPRTNTELLRKVDEWLAMGMRDIQRENEELRRKVAEHGVPEVPEGTMDYDPDDHLRDD